MNTNIQKWGNSQGIRIPKFLLEAMQWAENEELIVMAEEDKLVISKAERRKNIKDLFADFDGVYKPVEMDWGEPMGKEIW